MDTIRKISAAKLFCYQLPLHHPLDFNGHKLRARNGFIIQLQDNNKCCSYGEIAPLPGFSKETPTQAKEQLFALLNNGIDSLTQHKHLYPSVRFGLDAALQQIPIAKNALHIDPVPLLQGNNDTLIKQYASLNMPTLIKLKVGRQQIQDDLALFTRLVRLNPYLKIRCDANQHWSEQQADYFFTHIDKQCLDYIEEPTRVYQTNLQLAKKHQFALALDETLQDSQFNYQAHPCIKALILKPSLIGSLTRIEKFIDIASQQRLQVHISSSFESALGLQQLTALAHLYQAKCTVSLGIDTLKYFQPGLLTDIKKITSDLQKLECLWSSN